MFLDEIYISEDLSPGHATLPRRSNSPLPHERDIERDRYPINRSGLQVSIDSYYTLIIHVYILQINYNSETKGCVCSYSFLQS